MTEPSLVAHLARLAAESPDASAVTVGEASVTRRELDLNTNRLARTYVDAGVTPDSFVAILLPNSVEFVEAAIAVLKCGATPLPLSVRLPPRERDGILALARPSLVIGEALGEYPILPGGAVGADDDSPLPDAVAASWKVTTSGGSTGRPKLIVSTQPAVRSSVEPFARFLGMVDDGTVLVTGPLFHNAPFQVTMNALSLGAHVVVMPRFDAVETLDLVDRHGVDWVYLVPTMMSRIRRLPAEVLGAASLATLRVVMHMAAPCAPWLKREWIDWLGPERIWELYTATEVQAIALVTGDEWLARPGTVGRPAIGEMKVLDADHRPAAVGEIGTIWMRRGAGLPNPYRYIGAKPHALADGWESVGDLGRMDADGYLYLADRESDMFVVGGANVYPAEVESALSEHPAVRTAVVIGLPHEDLGCVPHALLELESPVSDDELREHLQQRLVRYKMPRSYERVSEPLRDDAGKVRRAQLRSARVSAP